MSALWDVVIVACLMLVPLGALTVRSRLGQPIHEFRPHVSASFLGRGLTAGYVSCRVGRPRLVVDREYVRMSGVTVAWFSRAEVSCVRAAFGHLDGEPLVGSVVRVGHPAGFMGTRPCIRFVRADGRIDRVAFYVSDPSPLLEAFAAFGWPVDGT